MADLYRVAVVLSVYLTADDHDHATDVVTDLIDNMRDGRVQEVRVVHNRAAKIDPTSREAQS